MKNLILLFICLLTLPSFAQSRAGEVQYKYTVFWSKIYNELPFLSREEKDRILLTWGNSEGYSYKTKLLFNADQSLYTYDDSEDVAGRTWRKGDYIIHRNFSENKILELQETLGKVYLIQDDLINPKWRIMNELKEIQGHLCMKAILTDTILKRHIEAWFAADIPVPAGPEVYFGLPGLILGMDINHGNLIIEAEKLSLSSEATEIKLPKKMKGKEINLTELNQMLSEHMKNSIANEWSPYNALRY